MHLGKNGLANKKVREAFEKAQSNALPAPDSDDDEDDVPMY